MLIIGIDPGISGSICFFQDGKIIDVVEMPTMAEGKKNKKQVNGSQIFNEISVRIKKLDKNDIKVVIEYGMLTEDKFYDKAESFNLYPSVDNKYYTYQELEEKIKDIHTDKEGNLIILYAQNKDEQYTYIESAKEKGYEVLLLDSPIIPHLIQKLESKKEKVKFSRVDSDTLENLIKKDDQVVSKLSDEEKEKLKTMIENAVSDDKYTVQLESLDSKSLPFMLAQPEFMRRMKEMQQSGGGGMGNMPEMYSLIVNTNHELVSKILTTRTEKKRNSLIKQSVDLAKLSQNVLTGKELTEFINRSIDLIK